MAGERHGGGASLVNKRELAAALDVHEQTISRLIEAGCPVEQGGATGTPYQFNLDRVRNWVADREARLIAASSAREAQLRARQKVEISDPQSTMPRSMSAKETREWLQAEHIAQRLAVERRQLIPREEVARDYAAVFGVIRQNMLGLAPKLVRSLNLDAPQQHQVEVAVRQTLIELHAQLSDPCLRYRREPGEPSDHQ
jgi:phage terminase Nu1 subunit (DNA packaging protein)